MIKITIPNNNVSERKYIIQIIFKDFLGLDYMLLFDSKCNDWKIELKNGSTITFQDHFFNKYPNDLDYLHVNHTPLHVEYATSQYTPENDIPVIYGNDTYMEEKQKILCGIDIFASSFFMLTRWEEYVNKVRDQHDRFPAVESLAFKHHFLDRPIVNEYVEMLKNMLLYLDSTIEFKKHTFETKVSCDVDEPFDCTVENVFRLFRVGAGDLIKRKSIAKLKKRIQRYWKNKLGDYSFDENYTFEWYMNTCEKHGLKAAFYFIPDSREAGNGCYRLEDKKIQKLIKYIDSRGHEVGVHGSYQTYKNHEKAKIQKRRLDQILLKLQINQKVKGNRQHYLRWDAARTPSLLEFAGFEYDTTGSFADRPGFRFGVCYEFSMFDFLERTPLQLLQRPLIVMECSIIDAQYMGLGYTEKAIGMMKNLKQKCNQYNGVFSLLWHNSHFKNTEDKKFFMELIK